MCSNFTGYGILSFEVDASNMHSMTDIQYFEY